MKRNLHKGKSNFGFTLIELLVVVVIIGIIAAVVLASLNDARTKGGDAAIKSNLANIRGQAELLFSNWGVYAIDASPTYFNLAQCASTADTLFADPYVWAQISGAYTAGAGVASTMCYSSAVAWAVAVQLKTGGTAGDATPDSWCVDSTGASRAYAWTAGQTISNSVNVDSCR